MIRLFSKIIVSAFLMILTIGEAKAQVGINLLGGFPQGDFRANTGRTGFGIGGEFLFQPNPLAPFALGVNVNYINYGSESRRVPLSNFIQDITVDVDRSNNIVQGMLMLRLWAPTPFVKPYVDILGGGSYIYTQTTLKERYSNQEKLSDVNFSDWAWSYGAGGGLMLKIYSEVGTSIWLDLGARYIYTTEAEYLTEGDIVVNVNPPYGITYNSRRSKMDLLVAHIGAFLEFSLVGN